MVVMVEAIVTYACYLSEEDAQKVRDYADENDVDLEKAVEVLYGRDDDGIDLYKDARESDFATNDILSVEDDDE